MGPWIKERENVRGYVTHYYKDNSAILKEKADKFVNIIQFETNFNKTINPDNIDNSLWQDESNCKMGHFLYGLIDDKLELIEVRVDSSD